MKIIDYFSRATNDRKFIAEIDGIRFIAIFYVVLFHLFQSYAYIVRDQHVIYKNHFIDFLLKGHYGVNFFFVVSAFILTIPFAKKYLGLTESRLPLKSYYARRIARLEPTFITNITIIYLIYVLFYGLPLTDRLANYFATITYTHIPVFKQASIISNITWSLEVEVQYYIIAPFMSAIFLVGNKVARRTALLLLIFFASVMSDLYVSKSDFSLSVLNYFHYFLAGVLLADVYLCEMRELENGYERKPLWGDFLTLVGAGLVLLCIYEILSECYFMPASLLVLYYGFFNGRFSGAFIRNKLLVTIGGMCYTIYLYHQIINISLSKNQVFQGIVMQFSHNLYVGLLLFTLLVSLIIILISAFFFLIFEKPFMKKGWYRAAGGKVQVLIKRGNPFGWFCSRSE